MTTIKADNDDLAIDPAYYDQIEARLASRRLASTRKNIRRELAKVGLKQAN